MSLSKRKRETVEFRYYEIPKNESVLALLGDSWKRNYRNASEFMHFHNLWEVGYCYYGEGNMEFIDGETNAYYGGTFTFIPANIAHNTRTATLEDIDYWEFLFLDVEKFIGLMHSENHMASQLLFQQISKHALVLHERDYPELASLIKLMMNEMRAAHDRRSELMKYLSFGLILQMARITPALDSAVPLPNSKLYCIKPALELVREKYSQQIIVQDLADCCKMSETHFRRIFEDVVNMTPLSYINFVRIQRACELLHSTNYSIEIIAQEAGFISQSAFNRNFTKFVGVSPLKWKRTAVQDRVSKTSYNISVLEGWT